MNRRTSDQNRKRKEDKKDNAEIACKGLERGKDFQIGPRG